MELKCRIHRADGSDQELALDCRIDTEDEVAYYTNGGILHHVLRSMLKAGS